MQADIIQTLMGGDQLARLRDFIWCTKSKSADLYRDRQRDRLGSLYRLSARRLRKNLRHAGLWADDRGVE